MYRLIFILIAGILGLLTLCVGVSQPKMHKTLFVYNSDYKIVVPSVKTETVKSLPTQVNVAPLAVKTVKKTPVKKPVEMKTVAPVQTVEEVQETNPLVSILTEKTKNITPVEQVVEKTQTQAPAPKVMTEAEKAQQETILWNKWRSDLQNKIMTDVKLPIIQEGTIFKFSFDVDKYGKISNVQTWSLNPTYTPYAIQYIAPVIRSYQGRDILNFPEGSNRISTTVEGGWKISKTAKFSTPEDYRDSEKIINKD